MEALVKAILVKTLFKTISKVAYHQKVKSYTNYLKVERNMQYWYYNALSETLHSIVQFSLAVHKLSFFWCIWNLSTFAMFCCCCRLPDPFRGMGAWRMTMEPQNPGNSPGSGPEVVQKQRVSKEWAAQRVRSWTVQNEMRSVLGRVSAGAAGRILDSANPREIRI